MILGHKKFVLKLLNLKYNTLLNLNSFMVHFLFKTKKEKSF